MLSEALYGKQVQKLVELTQVYYVYWQQNYLLADNFVQNFSIKEAGVLLLAIFRTVTMGYCSARAPMDETVKNNYPR